MRLTTCKLKHLWLFAAALPLLFVASAADVGASTTPPRADVWQPNGAVYAIEMSKEAGVSRAYIGGDFTYVGPVTGNASAVIVAGANFPVITPSFNGPVHTTIAADNEGWYVGGNFSSVTDKDGVVHARNNLAQIDGKGNVMAWHPDLNGAVRALVYDGLNNRLYVGGDFTQVNVAADTQNRDYLAAFDTTVDLDSDTNWNPDLNGIVRALALDSANDRLYVGGDFTRVNVAGANLLRNRIVEFDVAALVDSPTIWNPDVNNTVRALAFDLLNNRLYAGGDFTQVNVAADPQTRNRLAVFDTQVSDDNAFNWNPDADNSVNALGLALGTIYVGGRFTAINGTARNALVAIDITDITPVTFSNSNLLWGGTELPFIGADPSSLSVNQIVPGSLIFVAWEGQLAADLRDLGRLQALALDGTVAWTVDAAGPIYTARPSGDNILLGGAFNSGGGHIRSHLAEINLGTGVGAGTATNWSAFVDGPVYSIVARDDGNGLYIGGDFSNVRTATTARNNIALLSTSSGNVEDWDPSITGGAVRTMALSVDQATLYVGGQFSTVAGVGRQRIAALDTTVAGVAGAGVLTDWNPGPNPGADGDVHSLVVSNDGSLVFAAGDFSIIGGVARSRIAALKVANGTPLSNALWAVNSVNGVVRTLALSDDDSLLYLGGDFTSIDDGTTGSPYSRNRIAVLEINGTSNQWSVAATIDPDVSAGTSVYSLDLSSDDRMLWVGGAFSALTSAPLPNAPLARGNVARYSLTEDSAIPLNAVTAWNPQLAGGSPPVYVTERTEDDGLVMVGGEFTSVAGAPHNYLALFDTLRPVATDHVAGGFYNTSPLDIILSCSHNSTAGPCSLFVTIDGSEPDQNSTEYLYTQPPPAPPVIPPPTTFDISAANTTVKFFARDAHGSVSDVITVDYGLDITFP